MDDVMAAMIYAVLAPILTYVVGAAFAVAAMLLTYRKIRDLFNNED